MTRAGNDQRREVARKLRKHLEYMRDYDEWYERDWNALECGNTAYRNIAAAVEDCGNSVSGNYVHIVERLAGLVDRPTCRNLATKPADELVCSACGERVDIAHLDSADDYHARYCPSCGAEVVRDAPQRG